MRLRYKFSKIFPTEFNGELKGEDQSAQQLIDHFNVPEWLFVR